MSLQSGEAVWEANGLSPMAQLLRCHACGSELAPEPFSGTPESAGDAVTVRCTACEARYPVTGGTVRMLDHSGQPAAELELKRQTGNSFAYEWQHFGALRESWAKNFADYMRPHSVDALQGKKVLDVGAGSGRHSFQAHRAGAHVVASDIGESIGVARENLPPDVLTLQADAERLPLAHDSFDFVISIGVLHHLPDTERAFRGLIAFARPGGIVHLYLYWHPPRAWHRVLLRAVEAVRRVTTRLPHRVLHPLCYPIAAALFAVFVLPYRLLRNRPRWSRLAEALPLKTYADYPFAVCVNDQFDRFSAPFERRFTEQEVRTMFESAGLEDVTVLPNSGWVASGRRPAAGAATAPSPPRPS